jgi:SH3 domain-containing YSC84-like protein 1
MINILRALKKLFTAAIFASLFFCPVSSFAVDQELAERLDRSADVFQNLMEAKGQGIPQDLFRHCEAVVIFPETFNLAWGIGGQFGRGVALRYDKVKHDWSAPAFYTIESLTLGPQIGGQKIDVVLLVMNEIGLKSLLKNQTTLGGDAGIALGPVGRNVTVSTDLGLQAEIYSYSKAKGLFIGLSLKGARVAPDDTAIMNYYGQNLTARDILMDGKGGHKKYSQKLLVKLRKYTSFRFPLVGMIFLWMAAIVGGLFLIGRLLLHRNSRPGDLE